MCTGLGIWGAFEGQHAFGGGGKIEFHEISPPPGCQNFCPPEFFSTHFFRNFFPDISNFFQTFKNCPGLPKMFLRPTKNVIFLATFHKFLHFCPSNSDISTTFGHFSQKSPLCWCGSYTHGSQRLMVSTEIIKNWGGGKMGGQKIIWGAFAPLAPPLAPPLVVYLKCIVDHNTNAKLVSISRVAACQIQCATVQSPDLTP